MERSDILADSHRRANHTSDPAAILVHGDCSRASCDVGDTQLRPRARISAGMRARALINLARFVAQQILASREAGIALKAQAVLFRASHHSTQLEIELTR